MRHVRVAVLGGGVNGQLAQIVIPDAEIFDWKLAPTPRALTRNYGANYLWKPLGDIPCREFQVITTIDGQMPTVEAVTRYKDKIGKSGDIVGWERQFQHRMPGFDFIEFPPTTVQYGHRVTIIDRSAHTLTFADGVESIRYDTLISTIPLYALLSLATMPEPTGGLKFKPIYTKISGRPPDAPHPIEVMYVNYISDPAIKPYRYCDRFGERHYESILPFDGPASRRLAPGKIFTHPGVPDILDILHGFNIIPIGRYGAWRSDELIHETWEDLHLIKETM